MTFAIDTNRYSDFARNVPEIVELFVNAEAIFVPHWPFSTICRLPRETGTLN